MPAGENNTTRSPHEASLPLAPSLEPALESAHVHPAPMLVNRRTIAVSLVAMALGVAASAVAVLLTRLIGLITHLSFYGRWDTSFVSPAGHRLGLWVILVPIGGALVVGLMARYGSAAIRGHGIPEAMEQVLFNESKIPARITFLKPVSAAISIGTGGPFGAEGPIIATGGALGSLIGQLLHTTAAERKTLLAAGAAAGMTATFGSPVSAVLLAIELLVFEFRPRSLVPIALASATAAAIRASIVGSSPVFPMAEVASASIPAMLAYVVEGIIVGAAAVGITKLVYAVEDAFEHLPIHWMWWPALGAAAVGVVGVFSPHTMGVGYDNIERILSGDFLGAAMIVFCVLKFVSWTVSLGSGTSGGTLAPLFTVGGGLGAAIGSAAIALWPGLGVDVRLAALVGMAATFAGASRALLASIVFAFETTRQPLGLPPLLAGCTASFLVSALLMRQTIMTEKIARRGRNVPMEYLADALEAFRVGEFASEGAVTLAGDESLARTVELLRSNEGTHHFQGYPVVDGSGRLLGVVTRKEMLARAAAEGPLPLSRMIGRAPVTIPADRTLREASDLMLQERVGRLVVVSPAEPGKPIGMLSRRDLLHAYHQHFRETRHAERTFRPFSSLDRGARRA